MIEKKSRLKIKPLFGLLLCADICHEDLVLLAVKDGDNIYCIFIIPTESTSVSMNCCYSVAGGAGERPIILWLVILNVEPEDFCHINILSFALQCDLFKCQPIYSNCYIKVLQTE